MKISIITSNLTTKTESTVVKLFHYFSRGEKTGHCPDKCAVSLWQIMRLNPGWKNSNDANTSTACVQAKLLLRQKSIFNPNKFHYILLFPSSILLLAVQFPVSSLVVQFCLLRWWLPVSKTRLCFKSLWQTVEGCSCTKQCAFVELHE